MNACSDGAETLVARAAGFELMITVLLSGESEIRDSLPEEMV